MKKGIFAGIGSAAALLLAMPAAAVGNGPAATTGSLAPASTFGGGAFSAFTAFGPLSVPMEKLLQQGLTTTRAAAARSNSASSPNKPDANGDVYCYFPVPAPPVVPHDLIVPSMPDGSTNACVAIGTQVGHDVIVEPAASGSGNGLLSNDLTVGHDVRAGDNSIVGLAGGTVSHDVSIQNPLAAEVVANTNDIPLTRAVIGHDLRVTGSAGGVVACGTNVGQDVFLNNDFGMIVGDSNDQSDFFGDPLGCDGYGGGVLVGHDLTADNNNGGPIVDISDNSPNNPAGAGGIGHDFFARNDSSTASSGPVVENNAIAKNATCDPPATSDGPDAPNQVGGKDNGCNAWAP